MSKYEDALYTLLDIISEYRVEKYIISNKEIEDAARYDNFDELENCKRDPQFQEYYKLNASIRSAIMEGSCVYIFGNTEEELLMNLSNLNINKDFCITTRTAVDGVHELGGKGAFDIDYNVNKFMEVFIC